MIGPNNKRPEFADDLGVGSRCLDLLEKIADRYDPQKKKVDNLQKLALTDAERLQFEASGAIRYRLPEPRKPRPVYSGTKTPGILCSPRQDNISQAVAILLKMDTHPRGIYQSLARLYNCAPTSIIERYAVDCKRLGIKRAPVIKKNGQKQKGWEKKK